jgi:hypothetical protein
MRTRPWTSTLILMASLLTAPVVVSGCYAGYSHYHQWNDSEATFYVQWETDTHRDHKDYAQRAPDEQKQYWDWRDQHKG